MLYDEEYIKNLPEMKPFENPWVVGICKNDEAMSLRQTLEKWYIELPEEIKPKFYSKLRSLDNNVFVATFHELAIYRYCIEEGWDVEYEQPLDSGLTPDLMIHTKDFGDLIVEVTTLFDSEMIAGGVTREEELTQKIGEIKTDFVLELSYQMYPPKDFDAKTMIKEVEHWLSSLPDDKETHSQLFIQGDFSFEIEASKTRPRPRIGCVLSVMGGGDVPNYSTRVKRKLDEKRKKYNSKKLGIPVVVALADGVGRMRVDSFLLDRSLFGEHQLTIYPKEDKPGLMTRDRGGHFTPSTDPTGKWSGKNTGISAVMFSSYRGSEEGFEMKVFHNPVAEIGLPYDIFHKMPQLIRTDTGKDLTMNWTLTSPDNHIDDEEKQRIVFRYDDEE